MTERDGPLRRAAALVRARSPTTSASRRSSSPSPSAPCSRRSPASARRSRSRSSMLVGARLQADEGRLGARSSPTPRPVAFGAIAIPIVTLAGLTGLPKDDLGAMVGRQTPFLALFVPLILVGMVDGWRGVRQCWPAAMVGGARVRDRPVRVLELRLGRADRHRRLAALGRRASWRSCASGSRPSRCAASRASAPGDRRRGRPPTPTLRGTRCAAARATAPTPRARGRGRPTRRT